MICVCVFVLLVLTETEHFFFNMKRESTTLLAIIFLFFFFPFFLIFYHSNRFVFRSWWIYVNMNSTYDLHSSWDRAKRDVVVPMQLWHRLWEVSTYVAPTFCKLKTKKQNYWKRKQRTLLVPRENRNYVRYALEVSLENDFTWWILRERHVCIRLERTQSSILNSHSVRH